MMHAYLKGLLQRSVDLKLSIGLAGSIPNNRQDVFAMKESEGHG